MEHDRKFELIMIRSIDMLPISYAVFDYFEEFIQEEILKKFKIILNTKWNYSLAISFCAELNHKEIPEHMKRFYGDKGFAILPPSSVRSEMTKGYNIDFLLSKIRENSKEELIAFCEILVEAIEFFFVSNYKKITVLSMASIWQKIDWNYLSNIPYPAKIENQKIIN